MNALDKAVDFARAFRARVEPHFAADTAAPGWTAEGCRSAGHCAVVAALLAWVAPLPDGWSATCVSATVNGGSHWWNRLTIDGETVDVDLTGDQFGEPKVQAALAPGLRGEARVRKLQELNAETLGRMRRLAARSRLLWTSRD